MKHEADGLYYLNAEMLRNAGSCDYRLNMWRREFGEADIPITLEMGFQFAAGSCLVSAFVIHMQREADKVTRQEHSAAYSQWTSSRCTEDECVAAMDLLAVRARREGRLA